MERLSQRFPRYSKLLYFYPSGYRKEYGEQMLQTLADMLDDPERSHASVWLHAGFDFPYSVIKQQVTYTGKVMATETPSYITRTAARGAVLLTPFFIFLALNGLLHNRLQHSWVWNSWFLFIWIILLPTLALASSLSATMYWIRTEKIKPSTKPAWRMLRCNWPILSVLVISLGVLGLVFFHDSVHCVTDNPIRALHNPHQTWQCIERG